MSGSEASREDPGHVVVAICADDMGAPDGTVALRTLLGQVASALGGVAVGLDAVDATGGLAALERTEGAPPEPPEGACRAALERVGECVARDGWHARAVRDGAAAEAVLWAGPGAAGDVAPVMSAAASRAGWVLERGRLRAGLERAMSQVLEDDERMLGRMGLDIHDGPTQQLSVALLEIQLLDAELVDAESGGTELPPALRPGIARIYETLGGALHEMRELIGHLRPAQFQDRSLDDILGDAIAAFEVRTDVPVERRMQGEFPVNGVSVSQRITFYRILQEALANAHRHGHARLVRVDVSTDETGTRLVVEDDGTGFDAAGVLRDRAQTPPARHGLHGMQDRARLLGGTFHVESTPGRGTVLTVFLPHWQPTGPLHEAAGDL